MRSTNIYEADEQVIYLDGFATMPLCDQARQAMIAVLARPFNASSAHVLGEHAASVVDDAAGRVASVISAAAQEITFTSGATESNNIALLGGVRAFAGLEPHRRKVIISAIEHKAVLEPARALEREGYELEVLPVQRNGIVDVDQLVALADERTALVSVMAANNETGVIQPLADISAIARAVGALVHSDLAQAYGKVPLDDAADWLDYASISSHKIYGPQGVGALYVGAGAIEPAPLIYGGGQQKGLRPGTLPVAAIAGFGAAADAALMQKPEDRGKLEGILRIILDILQGNGLQPSIVGDHSPRLPGAASITVTGIDAEQLCATVAKDVCISTGSACNSRQLTTSHVFTAMGVSEVDTRSSFRICIPREISEDHARKAASVLSAAALRQFHAGRSVQAC